MAKIIEIKSDIIFIGKDDGTIMECRLEDLSFEPVVGKKVEIFQNELKLIVTEKISEPVINQVKERATDGINITIENSNVNGATPTASATGSGKVVNKTSYLLFAIFLGGFGAHKFYSGKIGLGVLYLVFCWTYVPSIISFIEFVIGCFKPADSNGNIVV